ncbi:hypothetical protein FRC02_001887 [Tulasnella sp. 418]|nr:hypothetical protein FRC02_001887 [Tulasnella sp. 418]
MSAKEVVQKYLTAYTQLDYATMESLTTDNFVFEDPAFPHLEGEHARGMFKMFIQGAPKTGAKFTVVEVNSSEDDPSHKVTAKYDASYNFEGRPVVNHMSSVFLVNNDGKIEKQVDTFDFSAWASQALGIIGMLFGSFGFLRAQVQKRGADRLEAFLRRDREERTAN